MTTASSSGASPRLESFADDLTVRIDERGSGRPILVLHGGGGPETVSSFAQALAQHAYVLVPIHPGFAGQPRPEWFDGIDDLALTYLELLERRDLRDVLVIGFSVGGWIAAELALRAGDRVGSIVLVDAVGIQVSGHEVVDVFPLTPLELTTLSFHNPGPFSVDPATLTPAQIAARVANFQTLAVYGQARGMSDPKLHRRLARVKARALVVWGESDGVVDVDYGRAYAQGFRDARFELIPEAGHLPQIEQPERLLELIREFADADTNAPVAVV